MKRLQVAISFDCTGSMATVLSQVRRNITELLTNTFSKYNNIQISITKHGNYCDMQQYQIQTEPFTSDIQQLIQFVNKPNNIHGGDYEAIYEKVMKTYSEMQWDEDALKILVIIGDEVPYSKNKYIHYKLPFIDWQEQVQLLKEKHIQIYSIQALSSGLAQSSQYQFYQYIARNTDGIHMQLQQFSQINDILDMIILDLVDQANNTDLLCQYKDTNNIQNHGMLNVYKAIKRQPQDESCFNIQYTQQPKQIVQKVVVSQLDESVLTQLVPCSAAKYQIIDVDQDCSIDQFVAKNQLLFKIGYGFYEFTQPSIIQNDKLIVVFNKITGQLYEGPQARQLFHIKNDCTGRQKPIKDATYSAFIQSTSYNRKLLIGTKFLYIAQDYKEDLPEFKPSYIPVDPVQQQKVKDSLQNTLDTVQQLKTQLHDLQQVRTSLVDSEYETILDTFCNKLNSLVKF